MAFYDGEKMKTYSKTNVSEAVLEDLIRTHAGMIGDEGLVYVDHQRRTVGGRWDVLMVDSGQSLVVAELKIVEDDGMLFQGLDYYDFVSSHVETYARLYKDKAIDPTKEVRLFLIAPSFSQVLTNRCKWLDVPTSLFTFNCLKFDDSDEIIPIFSEHNIPTPPPIVEPIIGIDEHLAYITDSIAREKASSLLEEIKSWRQGSISIDSIKYDISIKVNGRVFAYLNPRRKFFLISTYNDEDEWTAFQIKNDEDLLNAKTLTKLAMERKANLK
jgi:hypothetical protein